MNTRIFSASLFSAALLCVALPASAAIRPEIAQHLELAQRFADHGVFAGANEQIKEAGWYSNETDEEKQAVAQARAHIRGSQPGSSANLFGRFPTYEDEARPDKDVGRPYNPN